MERRNFIRLSVAGIAAGVIAPAVSVAESAKPLAGADIYYTKDAPGRWSGKVATHLPTIEIKKTGEGVVVTVVTAHEMKGYEHYIVKHVLLDHSYKFLQEHLFDPSKDTGAISTFTLIDYKGPIYALSLCNKHDLWLNGADV